MTGCVPVPPRKLFGVGPNKTGTTSLALALRQLGFRTLHDDVAGREIIAALQRGAHDPRLDEYEAFLDAPYWQVLPQIDARFGDAARYLLHTREREAWITSRLTHVLHNRLTRAPGIDWLDVSTSESRTEWDLCHQTVQKWFAPDDPRLLVLDLPAGDGWDRLCRFLERPIPTTPFPHVNTGAARLRDCLQRMDGAGQ